MKKLLYTILAAAATLFAVSCEKEVAQAGGEEGLVKATFSVSFANPATKAISDGTTATQLVVAVYDKAGNSYVENMSKDIDDAFTGLQATYTTTLVKGHGYDIVFLAQKKDNGAYTIDKVAKTLTVATAGTSNDEARDAFWGTYSIDKVTADAITETVTLKRPFAQVNVINLKDDFEKAKEAFLNFEKSSMTITAPTVMNLLTGAVSEPKAITLAPGAMAAEHPDFEPYKTQGDYWLMDNYVLAGTDKATADISFALYEKDATDPLNSYDVPNVPLQRNWRTNIYGNLLTSDGSFTVIIAPAYDGAEEFPIGGKVPTVTMTDTTLPAAGTALDAEIGDQINFKATHEDATVLPTYKSSAPAVGTISEAGLFTAVAAGTTTVTVSFPAKGDEFASVTLTWPVTVAAAPVVLSDPELTVTGAPTAAVEPGAQFGLVVATKSDAPVVVAVNPVAGATVAEPTADGYLVTAAADLTADTEVTITFSQIATATYQAASKDVKFTVKKKADEPVVEETKTVTVAQFLAAEVSATQKYQLTGKIAKHNGSINTTYGNFDLVDDSGTVYVYGLTKEEAALTINDDNTFKGNNDKSFAQLGLEEGDTVTLIGYRGVYNEEIEVVGAYYVSHVKDTTPKFGATINSEAKVSSDGGTKTITVTGNVAWTVVATNGATVAPASGEGAGTIAVTIPANTSTTDEPTYVVTVSTTADVTQKDFAFTITQNKVVEVTGENKYVKVTTITSGKKYLIVGGGQDKALVPAITSGRMASVGVTISSTGEIASTDEVDANAVTITANGTSYDITFVSDGTTYYLVYANNSNQKTDLKGDTTASDTWNVSDATNGTFRFASNAVNNRCIAFRAGTTNMFGGYATSNINGTEYFDIDLYEYAGN